MRKLIFGCGYLGQRVARRWAQAGDEVLAVTRSAARAQEFQSQGWQGIVADVLDPKSLARLPAVDVVLYAIGYDRQAGASMHAVYVDGLKAALDALDPRTGKFVYVSSTGVYAQSSGEWVDEDSPCQPVREGGRACLAAEQALAAHQLGRRSIVLRMAGIYGPGRVPNLDGLRRGEPLAAPADGWLNLIHVDDAAAVVLAAERDARPPRLYVVSDGHPVLRRDYYAEVARLAGAPQPRFTVAAAESPATSRATADKRINNRRLVAELRFDLQFPSYRKGLAAIVAGPRT